MTRPSGSERRSAKQAQGRTTAVRPGDRRDGQPLIFGWGSHLTRAQKQRYRERFVLAGGAFVFFVVVLVIGLGALRQYFFAPRSAQAKVNGATIQRQWYEKNLAYNQFVLQHEIQDVTSQFQALNANTQANAAATATANPQLAATTAPAQTPTSAASNEATSQGTGTPAGTPTATFTPAPTFNPTETATVGALTQIFTKDQSDLSSVTDQTLEDLIDVELMKQNAGKFNITVSPDDVSAEAKKTTDRIGGDAGLKQLFSQVHLSQNDFNQIQSNMALKDDYQAYFAGHPDQAPPPSPTPAAPATATAQPGPQPPTPVPTPTAVPTPGADSLDSWLEQERASVTITRSPLPRPTPSGAA